MRNATTELGCLSSTNELEFRFPYAGGSTANICFRQSPRFGFDAWVDISRGQFNCIMGCSIRVKIDNGPVQSWRATGAAGGRATMVFITDSRRFLASALRAHRIVVEADFYEAGSQQMVFEDAGGLEWATPPARVRH